MTKPQRFTIIDLDNERRGKKRSISVEQALDTTSISNTNSITNAIIAGIKQGLKERPDDHQNPNVVEQSDKNASIKSKGNSSAVSRNVGKFFVRQGKEIFRIPNGNEIGEFWLSM